MTKIDTIFFLTNELRTKFIKSGNPTLFIKRFYYRHAFVESVHYGPRISNSVKISTVYFLL